MTWECMEDWEHKLSDPVDAPSKQRVSRSADIISKLQELLTLSSGASTQIWNPDLLKLGFGEVPLQDELSRTHSIRGSLQTYSSSQMKFT